MTLLSKGWGEERYEGEDCWNLKEVKRKKALVWGLQWRHHGQFVNFILLTPAACRLIFFSLMCVMNCFTIPVANLPSCKAYYIGGRQTDGVYTITIGKQSTDVWCDMTSDGGQWTVFQRRENGSEDFNRNWTQYENGFGNATGEFWLGSMWLHLLTAHGGSELRIDFNGGTNYTKYSEFAVASPFEHYMLTLGGFEGTLNDGLGDQGESQFSIVDDDDGCMENSKGQGAWWKGYCNSTNLNAPYASQNGSVVGPRWVFNDTYFYPSYVEMKLR